jgi:hypothetical protein
MKTTINVKTTLIDLGRWIGLVFSFLISLIIFSLLIPFPESMILATPAKGVVDPPLDMIINAIVNATLVFWIIKRSSYNGFKLILQLVVCVFGVQTFQTQLETAYFINAFPLLRGNFEVYKIIARGLLSSILFVTLATLITGRLKNRVKAASTFSFSTNRTIKISAGLGVFYFVLYFIFGYYVAFQSEAVRAFYGTTGELNSFVGQLKSSFMENPTIPFFQYCRGILWVICLLPILKGFTGSKIELIIFSGLFFALMPTVQLLFPNPLMPASVGVYHFVEVAISTGIFGAVAAWLIPDNLSSTLFLSLRIK